MKTGNFRYEFQISFVNGHEEKNSLMSGRHTNLFIGTADEAKEHAKLLADQVLERYPNATRIRVRELPMEAVAVELSIELSHLRKAAHSFAVALRMACQDWIEGKPVPSMEPGQCAEHLHRRAFQQLMPEAFRRDNVIVGPDGQVPLAALESIPAPVSDPGSGAVVLQ